MYWFPVLHVHVAYTKYLYIVHSVSPYIVEHTSEVRVLAGDRLTSTYLYTQCVQPGISISSDREPSHSDPVNLSGVKVCPISDLFRATSYIFMISARPRSAEYTIGICFETAKKTKAFECFFTGFQHSL